METLARALALIIVGMLGLAVLFWLTGIRFESLPGELLTVAGVLLILLGVSAFSGGGRSPRGY